MLSRTFDDSQFRDQPDPGAEYYAGLDYGKLATPSVLCIASKKDDHFHVDFLRKFRLGVQYGDINDAVIAACRSWRVQFIKVDRTGPGERPYEELVNSGVPVDGVRFTAGGTWDYLLGNLLALAEENKLRIPRHPELLLELRGFQFVENRGELRPVTHRSKDLVCALTLALDAGISRSGHVRPFAGGNRIFGVGGRKRESTTRNELM
jgi:hypothetical protein